MEIKSTKLPTSELLEMTIKSWMRSSENSSNSSEPRWNDLRRNSMLYIDHNDMRAACGSLAENGITTAGLITVAAFKELDNAKSINIADTISIPRFNAFKEPEYPKFPIENYIDGNKNITYLQKDIFNPLGKEDGITYALFAKALSSQYQREKFSVLDALYKRDFEKAKELRKEMLTNFDATDAINEMAKIDFSDSYSTESLYKKIDFLADRLDNEIVEKLE